MKRRIFALAVILAGLVLVSSCTSRATLRMRAASYANFLAGHGSKSETLDDYWSPVYIAMMKKQQSRLGKSAYDAANEAFRKFSGKSTLPVVNSSEIRVETRGRFARTFIRLSSPNAVRRQEGALRWVRVGITWYVFNGSSEEEKAYGRWPF